jgi:phosphoglycolate phosphatase-like HAD superfamily hydrolase
VVILFDMDDVLVDTVCSINKFHNDVYGTNFHYDDYKFFYLSKVWCCSGEEVMKKFDEYYNSIYFKNLVACNEAIRIVDQLHEKNIEMYVVTSRPKNIEVQTRDFLKKYYKNVFREIYFTDHCANLKEYKRKKSDVCLELGADIMIDDCPDYIRDCAKVVRRVLVPVKPWNIEKFPSNVYHFKDWKKIWELI